MYFFSLILLFSFSFILFILLLVVFILFALIRIPPKVYFFSLV